MIKKDLKLDSLKTQLVVVADKPEGSATRDDGKRQIPHCIDEYLGCIYKLTCIPDTKVYIGQAKLIKYKDGIAYRYGMKGRWSDHVSTAVTGARTTPIYQAICKYGADKFKLEILDVTILRDLDYLEDYYMEQLGTFHPHGYNLLKMPNGHTHDRIQIVKRKYGDMPVIDRSYIQMKILQLREELETHNQRLELLQKKGITTVTRLRIAIMKNSSAPRQDKKAIKYKCIVVYVFTPDKSTTKNAPKLRFGGVTSPLKVAYDEALEFVKAVQQKYGGVVVDDLQNRKL